MDPDYDPDSDDSDSEIEPPFGTDIQTLFVTGHAAGPATARVTAGPPDPPTHELTSQPRLPRQPAQRRRGGPARAGRFISRIALGLLFLIGVLGCAEGCLPTNINNTLPLRSSSSCLTASDIHNGSRFGNLGRPTSEPSCLTASFDAAPVIWAAEAESWDCPTASAKLCTWDLLSATAHQPAAGQHGQPTCERPYQRPPPLQPARSRRGRPDLAGGLFTRLVLELMFLTYVAMGVEGYGLANLNNASTLGYNHNCSTKPTHPIDSLKTAAPHPPSATQPFARNQENYPQCNAM